MLCPKWTFFFKVQAVFRLCPFTRLFVEFITTDTTCFLHKIFVIFIAQTLFSPNSTVTTFVTAFSFMFFRDRTYCNVVITTAKTANSLHVFLISFTFVSFCPIWTVPVFVKTNISTFFTIIKLVYLFYISIGQTFVLLKIFFNVLYIKL